METVTGAEKRVGPNVLGKCEKTLGQCGQEPPVGGWSKKGGNHVLLGLQKGKKIGGEREVER